MANADGPDGMLTLVCITCGDEIFFYTMPPAESVCAKCGGKVFRNFFTPTTRDEATESMLEDTTRSISLDGGTTDTTAGDIRDLNNP